MMTLPDPKHEAFATLRASGHDVISAYVHAGYSVKNVKSRSRKLQQNPNIKARIEHLKTCLPRIEALHQHHCPSLLLMPETRHEMLVWLWQVMSGARAVRPVQMSAATLYSRMQGWHLAKLLPQVQAQAQAQPQQQPQQQAQAQDKAPPAASATPVSTAIPPSITPAPTPIPIPIPDAAVQSPIPTATLTNTEKAFLASSCRENIALERICMPRSPENLARYQSTLANLAHPGCRHDTFGRPIPIIIPTTPTAATSAPTTIPEALQPSTLEAPQTTSVRPVSPVRPVLSSASPIAPTPSTPPVPPVLQVPSSPPQAPSPTPQAPCSPPQAPRSLPQAPHPTPHPNPLTLNPLTTIHPQPRHFFNFPRFLKPTRLAYREPRPAAVRP